MSGAERRVARATRRRIDPSRYERPWVQATRTSARRWSPPRPLVLVNGCFDLLHAGHLYLLSEARVLRRGGTLLVSLDSDSMVAEKKGPGRPILLWPERARALELLDVDLLHECGSDDEFVRLCETWRPDLRVRMEDYRGRPSRVTGISEVFLPRLGNVSTSEIIRRVQDTPGRESRGPW